jgi:hypothetical protein
MTTVERTIAFVLSLVLAVGSIFLFGDGFRLVAEWRVSALSGIFMMVAGLLAAFVFAYRAEELKHAWPISIIKAR